jgi:hypothetical protein
MTFAGSINLRLMTPSSDEIDALYPLIAEKIEYAKDYQLRDLSYQQRCSVSGWG